MVKELCEGTEMRFGSARERGMKAMSNAKSYRWGLATLLIATAGAFSAGDGKTIPATVPEFASEQLTAAESSRDLLALHRLSDPSFFRCYLCRLEPAFLRSATLRTGNSPAECAEPAAGQRSL